MTTEQATVSAEQEQTYPAQDTPRQQGQQGGQQDPSYVNVDGNERMISTVGGALLAWTGFKMRSTLGALAMVAGGALIRRGVTGHCNLYSALGVNRAGREEDGSASPEAYFERGIHVQQRFTIDKPAEELFRFWRNFENLPTFMRHLESVKCIDGTRSHWVAKAPAGRTVEWDAEIINEEPNRLIAWRSLGNADVDNAGSVRFLEAPGGRGTEVSVTIDYIPPAGRLGAFVAKLFGEEPQQQIQDDLRRFKRLMETGEIPTTEGQSSGACAARA